MCEQFFSLSNYCSEYLFLHLEQIYLFSAYLISDFAALWLFNIVIYSFLDIIAGQLIAEQRSVYGKFVVSFFKQAKHI